MRILVTPPYFRYVLPRYLPLFSSLGIEVEDPEVVQQMTESELLDIIDRYDGVIAGDDEFTAAVLEKGARHFLKVIVKWGVGVNAIDLEAANRLGIAVRYSPGALSDAVADVVWGYILTLARGLHLSDRMVRDGNWGKIPGFLLRGRKLGVIGVGNIGRQVALRAIPFGMDLLGYDIKKIDTEFLPDPGRMRMVSKTSLLENSDFVVLSCDLNPTSFHLISRQELSSMKNVAYLINVARGPIVDEKSLVEALETGQIAGAALDVYEREPLPQESRLRKLNTTLLSSHNAFNADKATDFIHENTVKELLTVLVPSYSSKSVQS